MQTFLLIFAIAIAQEPVKEPAPQDSTATTLKDFEKPGWVERKIPLAAEKSKAEIDAIVEKLKKDGILRYRFEKHNAANGNQHFVVACSPLSRQLDALENELRTQGLPITSGGNKLLTRTFNVTTDIIADIESQLKPKLPDLQIERGDRHYTIKLHGKSDDVATAERLLSKRGLLAQKQEKVFKLSYTTDAPKFGKAFGEVASKNITVAFDPQTNSIVAEGTKEELAIVEALVQRLDHPNKADAEITSLELPAAISTEEELRSLITNIGITSGITITYPTKDKRVVTGVRANIRQIEETLVLRGLLPRKNQASTHSPTTAKQTGAQDDKPAPAPFESAFDNIVRMVNTTTDDLGAMKSTFDLEPITVQIEPGETKGAIKVQGRRSDVEKAIKLLTERGFIAVAPEVKVFRLKHAVCTEIADTLQKLGLDAVTIGADAQTNSLIVRGKQGDLAAIEALVATLDQEGRRASAAKSSQDLKDPQAIDSESETRSFALKYLPSSEVAAILWKLEYKGAQIADEVSSNSIVVKAAKEEMRQIASLIAKLDVKDPETTSESNRGSTDKPSAAADLDNHVYRLMNISSSDAVNVVKQLRLNNVKVTEDARTNSLLIQSPPQELKLIIRIVSGIDMKEAKPDPKEDASANSPLGILWSDFAKAEAKSIATAGELRAAAAKFGDSHPTMIELRTRLETEVKIAFEFRHKLQQAEASTLRQQLTEIESRLTKRQKNQAAIIKARVESLLKMDELGWEAMTKPKRPAASADAGGETPLPTSAESPALTPSGKSRELSEAWERVDRDEYIPARTAINVAGPGAITQQFHSGFLVNGTALISRRYSGYGDNIVWVADKQLPSRMAAIAPFDIHAFRSGRFPSPGITDLMHDAKEGEQVWAFVPDQSDTLVKAKVFRKSGDDFSFDEQIAFGIEAEGNIEAGHVVCSDSGKFLGYVGRHEGSLGICWTARAIKDWMSRTALEDPKPKNPLEGRVIIALPGSYYLPDETKTLGGPPGGGGRGQRYRRDRTFYGSIVKGIILTHPAISKSELATSGKIFQSTKGKTLTVEKMKLSEDGRFTLIACKELTPSSGFASKPDLVRMGDFVVGLGQEGNFQARPLHSGALEVTTEPSDDRVESLARASQGGREPVAIDETGFELQWRGIFSSIGMPIVSAGGHLQGIVDRDVELDASSEEVLRQSVASHSVHVLGGDQLFRMLDEEINKLNESGGVARETNSPSNPPTNLSGDKAVARQEAANAFWKRIKEKDAVIPVHAYGRTSDKTSVQAHFGAIVKGFIFLTSPLEGDALAEVGEKSLPQRLVTITPGGLYGYHRDRLVNGYTAIIPAPKDGDTVWTIANGSQQSITCGKAFVSTDSSLDMRINNESEFTFESDGRIDPGAVVFSDAGDFLGMVTRNKGSIGVCETAQTICSAADRTSLARPLSSEQWSGTRFWITDPEAKKGFGGTIVYGAIVTSPEILSHDLSKLVYMEGKKQNPISVRRSVKICGDRLALLWLDAPALPSEGLKNPKQGLVSGDYCRLWFGGFPINGEFIQSGVAKEFFTADSRNPMYASRALKVDDKKFTLEWFSYVPNFAEPILDMSGQWVGLNLTEDEGVGQPVPTKKRELEIIKASEVFRAIEEESKKLAAQTPPEPEAPKTESAATEPPKEAGSPPP